MRLGVLAVTGITSGVGLRFAEIAAEKGLSVRGLVRDPERAGAKRLAALGVELVRGDLDDGASLLRLAKGADAFVVKILTRDVIYDASKAAKLLGWKPRVRALEGLAEQARAFAAR
jgi:nucleoside-diphosphate-sugar epimerase